MALMKENYFLDLGNEQIIEATSQFVDLENIYSFLNVLTLLPS